MSAVVAGLADDIIDAMLTRSHGLTLAAPHGADGGEYDSWRQGFSRRDVRRLVGAGLVGAGLVTADGERADVLADLIDGWSGNGDELVTWWMSEGLRGLDQRAARRSRSERLEPSPAEWLEMERDACVDADSADQMLEALVVCADAPAWFHAWCDRTVHAPKLSALAALGCARWLNGPTPGVSVAAWYPGLVAKFESRCRR